MDPEESSTLWDTPFLVKASAKKRRGGKESWATLLDTFTFFGKNIIYAQCENSHSSFTKGTNSWFWLKGRTEHLYGATVAGKLKNCWKQENLNLLLHGWLRPTWMWHKQHCYRSLFIPLPDVECVLEDGVHDPTNAEGRLDDIWNNFFHCGQTQAAC